MDKKFVGRCKPGKYDGQVDVGFTRDDLKLLEQNLNGKGYVNCRVNRGKESGKPYMEIVPQSF